MKKIIPSSELILNPDGSVYHLNLQPEQVARTILLAGDPNRIPRISKYFDEIECKVEKREFVTHTGRVGNKRVSAVSTGIGTDNIDIVINELDALFNINFETRTPKEDPVSLRFIRIGTSGSLQEQIGVDELLISVYGIGLDCLLGYYPFHQNLQEEELTDAFHAFSKKYDLPVRPQATQASAELAGTIGKGFKTGITLSAPGFYAPQGRSLRLPVKLNKSFFRDLGDFRYDGLSVTNMEMETSAIFGLSRMLGHRALSANAILANRVSGQFSKDPYGSVERLIREVMMRIEGLEE